MADILKFITGEKPETSCPRCGGNHLLIGCPEVESMTFDFDDFGRWVSVTFFDCREPPAEEAD